MSEFQCFRTVNQALHDRVRNLTDINWPEIYVFMESNAFLVLESELDYRIIPKGRVKFVMNCFVNSSASKESDGLCNSLFPNSSHRVTGMHSQGNSHRRRAHWGCAPLGELSLLCTVPPPPRLSACLFKGFSTCSLAPREVAASIYGWEIPREKCAFSFFIPLQCGMGEFSEIPSSSAKGNFCFELPSPFLFPNPPFAK